MDFQIGEKVIHCTFGLGEITNIEAKVINGSLEKCYVFQVDDMIIWIPMEDAGQNSLRVPTPPDEFIDTLPILSSPNESLLEDRVLRKKQLTDQLKDGKLASICRVVRDLSYYRRHAKLSDQERSILDRAVRSLLTEWTFTMHTTPLQAHQALDHMLDG
jgi:RNA polymerase-interacting CarD/CdnL/TRCF family regulator